MTVVAERDGGMVTAELAVALPALAVVLASCVGVVSALTLQQRCVDSAWLVARAAARGDSDAQLRQLLRAELPGSSLAGPTSNGELVTVTVSAPAHPFGAIGPAVTVSSTAAALAETTAAGGSP